MPVLLPPHFSPNQNDSLLTRVRSSPCKRPRITKGGNAKVARLNIANFRGIKSAELLVDGHTLMVGTNNVGKSTLCDEAWTYMGAPADASGFVLLRW